jgi:putative sugar O-methyltransferase
MHMQTKIFKKSNALKDMITEMDLAPKEVLPSEYWKVLNKKNFTQLKRHGYNNFKRTVALSYFTWLPLPSNPQILFLLRNLSMKTLINLTFQTLISPSSPPINRFKSWSYIFITRLLWAYALIDDSNNKLDLLYEPTIGNPPNVKIKNKIISQDIANSFLEYNSIFKSKIDVTKVKTVIELGPGYGRTAYVILKLSPNIKYILVDIPPALYIAQRYMTEVFRGKKIFKFRHFKSFEEVSSEFEKAQIICIMPHQLELLPKNYSDLFITISSLHEMQPKQIQYYFKQINRLTRYYFYFKQWKVSKIPYDKIIIRENDYPIPYNWKKIYWRQCKVQTNFFEALFQTKK